MAAALIGTAFLASTMQDRIISTQDVNKDDYLKAIADYIITNPGTPVNWGTNSSLPLVFGLAKDSSINPYELDMDKISRLNSQNNKSLSYPNIVNAAKLNIALGIMVSQIMTINILQLSNTTAGSDTSFTFTISTNIDSKPTSASLHCYVASENYLSEINSTTPETGLTQVTMNIPNEKVNQTLLIAFARAFFDDRITSYSIYNFAHSTQESTPSNNDLALSPLDYTLSFNGNSPGLTVQNGYVFSYSYKQSIDTLQGSQCPIPKLIDNSPLVLVVCGINSTSYFQEWAAYPQIPLKTGANFENSEQNIFSYQVTINGVLYKLDLSLGALPH